MGLSYGMGTSEHHVVSIFFFCSCLKILLRYYRCVSLDVIRVWKGIERLAYPLPPPALCCDCRDRIQFKTTKNEGRPPLCRFVFRRPVRVGKFLGFV